VSLLGGTAGLPTECFWREAVMMDIREQRKITRNNRSAPRGAIIPILYYRDVRAAVEWYSRVFGFTERLRIGEHRSQMSFGEAWFIVGELYENAAEPVRGSGWEIGHSIMLRVADVNVHLAHVTACGAKVLRMPEDFMYGERQYHVEDIGGNEWTFTQTLEDVDPGDWGGVVCGEAE